jgi:hypothetical protein
MRALSCGVLLMALASSAPALALDPATPAGKALHSAWSDGLAEVSTYESTIERYGEKRSYHEVLIFVKERFDARRMVKSDYAGTAPDHEFDVMKLARMLHFVTGIYDYHQSVNYFTPLYRSPLEGRGPGLGDVREGFGFGEHPAKLSLMSFEWCGNYFAEWLGEAGRLKERSFSYFDGEADAEREIKTPGATTPWLSEDGWQIWARGLAGYPDAARKGPIAVKVLTSILVSRFEHRPTHWVNGTVEVATRGDRDVVTFVVGKERTWTIEVERTGQRRILAYRSSDGQTGRLLKSERRAYWGEHGNKHLPLRHRMGLVDQADLTAPKP